MSYKIIDVKPIRKNTLHAFFTLESGPMTIEGWTYHVKNDKSWVNPPSREYADKETGLKKYAPIVRFPDKDRYWAFQEWAKEQVNQHLPKDVNVEAQPGDNSEQEERPF